MKWLLVALVLAGWLSIARADPSFRGTGVVGVWIGTVAAPPAKGAKRDTVKPQVAWRVVFDDGRIFRGLPTAGLADLDIARHAAAAHKGSFVGGTWGLWKADDKAVVATYPGASERLVVEGDKLMIDNAPFARAAEVNDLALDGAYSYQNPNDASFENEGCKPMIVFAADGAFVDRGGFVADCASPAAVADDAPGRGSYEVRDFSLVLRYGDGRVVRRSLTGVVRGDPARDASALYIVGQLWQKRSKPLPAVALIPPPAVPAAEVAFDVVAFTPPPGKVTRLPETIGFTSIDKAANTFCATSVFNSVPSAPTAAEDFAQEWRDTLGHAYHVTADPPRTPGTTAAGLSYLIGASLATKGTKEWYGQLLVFSLGTRRISIQVVSPDARTAPGCLAQIAPMLASLRVR
jgi:hypothetical protein